MNLITALLAAAIGYLLGSISWSRVVARFVAPDEDLSTTELDMPSSNEKLVLTSVSSTSLGARKGSKAGCLAAILDILKAFVPTLVFRIWQPNGPYYLIVAGMAVVGHNWPVYYRFKGGRGTSPIIGGVLAIDWLGLVVTNALASLFGHVVLRNPMVGFSLSLPLLILWFGLIARDWWQMVYALAVNVIYWIAVIPELRTYVRMKREGRAADFWAAIGTTPMGRGRQQLIERLSFLKRTRRK